MNLSLSTSALESLVVNLPKDVIEWYLETLAPSVQVVGHRMTEDGYELVLEGNPGQIADLVYVFGEECK